jgi:hypothetical protein
MARVYLSSTFLDLQEYRLAAIDAIRRADYMYSAMEYYPASVTVP